MRCTIAYILYKYTVKTITKMQSHHRAVGQPEAGDPESSWSWRTNTCDEDVKFHQPHGSRSFKQRISDFAWSLKHVKSVPISLCLVLMCLCGFIGSFFGAMGSLPTPSAPQATLVGGGHRALLVVSDKDGMRQVSSASTKRNAAQKRVISTEQDLDLFQNISLFDSGFSSLRPALKPAASGDAEMRAIPFQTISWYPRITYYPGFVDAKRCQHVMEVAKKRMFPSQLAYKPGDSIPEEQEVRTSSGTFLSREQDKDGVLAWIEEKIAAVTHLPVEHGEAFNVLRYTKSQHYDSHMDTFDPKEFGPQASQRVATFLLFLHAPEEGGETVFKREGRDGANRTVMDWRGCSDGLGVKVKPQTGDAVLFWSATPANQIDPRALHGACPVIKGEKWSMAKWIHEKPLGVWAAH